MTVPELMRYMESKQRVEQERQKEQAIFDYTLANLIGHSIGRLYSSANKYPTLADAYPSLFTADEIEAKMIEQKDALSALKFTQFAQAYNDKYKEAANTSD